MEFLLDIFRQLSLDVIWSNLRPAGERGSISFWVRSVAPKTGEIERGWEALQLLGVPGRIELAGGRVCGVGTGVREGGKPVGMIVVKMGGSWPEPPHPAAAVLVTVLVRVTVVMVVSVSVCTDVLVRMTTLVVSRTAVLTTTDVLVASARLVDVTTTVLVAATRAVLVTVMVDRTYIVPVAVPAST